MTREVEDDSHQKFGEMASKATREIANKIVSYFLFQWLIFIITTIARKLMQYFVDCNIPLKSSQHKAALSPMVVKMW